MRCRSTYDQTYSPCLGTNYANYNYFSRQYIFCSSVYISQINWLNRYFFYTPIGPMPFNHLSWNPPEGDFFFLYKIYQFILTEYMVWLSLVDLLIFIHQYSLFVGRSMSEIRGFLCQGDLEVRDLCANSVLPWHKEQVSPSIGFNPWWSQQERAGK
mgnify:CR=1 FL=1